MDDYYKILGVPRNATPDKIRQSYLTLIKRYHPDVCHENYATDLLKKINEAYGILSDPQKKNDYDIYLNQQRSNYNYNQSRNDISPKRKLNDKQVFLIFVFVISCFIIFSAFLSLYIIGLDRQGIDATSIETQQTITTDNPPPKTHQTVSYYTPKTVGNYQNYQNSGLQFGISYPQNWILEEVESDFTYNDHEVNTFTITPMDSDSTGFVIIRAFPFTGTFSSHKITDFYEFKSLSDDVVQSLDEPRQNVLFFKITNDCFQNVHGPFGRCLEYSYTLHHGADYFPTFVNGKMIITANDRGLYILDLESTSGRYEEYLEVFENISSTLYFY